MKCSFLAEEQWCDTRLAIGILTLTLWNMYVASENEGHALKMAQGLPVPALPASRMYRLYDTVDGGHEMTQQPHGSSLKPPTAGFF